MGETFLAVDVETANPSRASICEIGIIAFVDGAEAWRWRTLVNPEEPFDAQFYGKYNFVHPSMVLDAPTFPSLLSTLAPTLQGQVLVHWGTFDQDAVSQAAEKYGVEPPRIRWLDAMNVAKQAWPGLKSYALAEVAGVLGYEFRPHVAIDDAWACGMVLQSACAATGRPLDRWLATTPERRSAAYTGRSRVSFEKDFKREGVPDCILSGHVALFTGTFAVGKTAMGELACRLGCAVNTNWSKKITLLVVASDPGAVGGDGKSEKLIAAETAQASGRNLTIWSEAEFL